ncbi:hypothetical protein VD0002_g7263 [Verticillium dahliae]|nr:hypothetical protein VD0003_g7112 [Verticillium dahliae]PNH60351.1 hypothetical protein VD0002_g7263 [Verticillium dahliae]
MRGSKKNALIFVSHIFTASASLISATLLTKLTALYIYACCTVCGACTIP